MTITGAHVETVLRSIRGAYGGQVATVDVLAAGANEALLTAPAGLTQTGAAAFLATMSQESASFRATEEYAKNGRYAPFIGRTFEMVTWEDNYRAFGRWCVAEGLLTDPEWFVKSPKRLADIRWAWLGGVWFWQAKGIWAYGNSGDFLATQRAVNLGNPRSSATPVGMAARTDWYKAWRAIGSQLIPDPPTPEKGFPLMAEAQNYPFTRYAGDQPLKKGENTVQVNADGDVTLIIGENDGVDLHTVIVIVVPELDDEGNPITDDKGQTVYRRVTPEDGFESWFRLISYKSGTDAIVKHDRTPTRGDKPSWEGTIHGDAGPGRSLRLRLIVKAPVDGARVDSVQFTGWNM